MIKRSILVVVLFLYHSWSLADQVFDGLNRFFTEVTTLDTAFYQEVFDEGGNSIQRSQGRLKLYRPGRFRWEYTTPTAQLILADGRNLWIYDVELEQATVKPVTDMLGATPITLLTELRPLEDEFLIEPAGERAGLHWVELTPRTQDTEFNRVELGLLEDQVRQMELHDQFGQKTVIRFEGMKTNLPLPRSEFQFDVPPGVDVIGVAQ
ncbi:MAG: outer membrane lipoprotein chaperone LolA [Gammaproteobacteria bacterium]|nr:outer membrane lipoprotein chaperone LolA [Gammaproteobacteria bacterium]